MNDAALLSRLARSADELERTVGAGQWPALARELAELLLRVDEADGDLALRRDVDRLIETLLASPADDVVRQALSESAEPDWPGSLRRDMASEAETTFTEAKDGYAVVPVFYGTDREMTDSEDPARRYNGNRGIPGFGVAEVSIPDNHKVAQLEDKGWWQWFSDPNPEHHVVLLAAATCERARFVELLSERLTGADRKELLVFVHGYNVQFKDAARRTAQLAYDLKFPGPALLYSWPSRANVKDYLVDSATIEWSTPHLLEFVKLAMSEVGAQSVSVIAHSMGTRALVAALDRMNSEGLPARLHQVILAAPDIDAGVFRNIAPALRQCAARVTLYGSENDKALLVSRLLQRYPRAGDGGERLVIVKDIETIDASAAETGLFGLNHSYFGSKRSILTDIHALLHRNLHPDERFDLRPMRSSAGPYWTYKA